MRQVLSYEQTYRNASGGIFYPESDGQPIAETNTHIKLTNDLKETLDRHFADDPNVYVTGCIMFYYMESVPEECVSPDMMVCFGAPKGDRVEKKELSAMPGVREYFIYNPEHPKTLPALLAYRLGDDRQYETIKTNDRRIFSQALNLGLIETDNTLRLFNPAINELLPTAVELSKKLEIETKARIAAETEIERLKAELARLKTT